MNIAGVGGIGQAKVSSVSDRGFTPEELVVDVMDKLRPLIIGMPPNEVKDMLVRYGEQCVASYRTSLMNEASKVAIQTLKG